MALSIESGMNLMRDHHLRSSRPARTYKPTKSDLAAIRKGEAEIARGDSVSLSEFLHGLASKRRQAGMKANRKVSR